MWQPNPSVGFEVLLPFVAAFGTPHPWSGEGPFFRPGAP